MFEFLMAFLLGLLSIFSPCVLPVIPFIFAGSRGRARNAALIVAGLITSTILAGLLASLFYTLKIVAYVFMIFFSAVLLSEKLAEKLETFLSARLSRVLGLEITSTLPSFVFGFLLAFIWLPCIIPFAGIALAQTALLGDPLVMIFYGIGMALAIAVVVKLGEKIAVRDFEKVRRAAGFLILLYTVYFAAAEML